MGRQLRGHDPHWLLQFLALPVFNPGAGDFHLRFSHRLSSEFFQPLVADDLSPKLFIKVPARSAGSFIRLEIFHDVGVEVGDLFLFAYIDLVFNGFDKVVVWTTWSEEFYDYGRGLDKD